MQLAKDNRVWSVSLLIISAVILRLSLFSETNGNGGVNFVPFLDLRHIPNEALWLYFRTIIVEYRFLNHLVPVPELIAMFSNILVFIPFGFFLSGLIDKSGIKNKAPLILLVGFGFSFLIEFVQLFLPTRYSDIDDLILNTLGVTMGLLTYYMMRLGYFPAEDS